MPTLPPLDPNDPASARTPQLTARADRALVRAGSRSTRYALVGVTAPRAPRCVERIPVNLALVLDRSAPSGQAQRRLVDE